jgi:DNA-binding MarR family transcriptional regulator
MSVVSSFVRRSVDAPWYLPLQAYRVYRCVVNNNLDKRTEGVSIAAMTVSVANGRPLNAHDPRIAPWRAFLLAHSRISRRMDEELRTEHDLSFAEYDTLLTIANTPDRRIRMGQLADEVVLSKSGVTRLIDRLVSDGLVERSSCLADGRGAEAVLTDRGLARLREASRTHLRGIQQHFLDVLDTDDLATIERCMTALTRGVGPDVER